MKERTLCIVKPDAVRSRATWDILSDIERAGLRVVQVSKYHFTKEAASEFYKEHRGKEFFFGLVEFMTSGPCYVAVLEGIDAVKKYRELMGSSDPKKADICTLRSWHGTCMPANAVHGSDSSISAEREIAYFGGTLREFIREEEDENEI